MAGSETVIVPGAGVTLEYVADRWGLERIMLDGVQNHLPGDSGASRTEIQYYINGKLYPMEKGKKMREKGAAIGAVVFSDDGRGFDYRKLKVLYSDKPNGNNGNGNGDSSKAVGQFGEGIKMICAAGIREGIQIKIRSRDWSATPFTEQMELDGKPVNQLMFRVNIGSKSIVGSQTAFLKPNSELLDLLEKIGDRVLHLRSKYEPVYSSEEGSIVDESGDIFVKGVFISDKLKDRLLWGYDLNIEDIPRDRDHVKDEVLGNAIGELLRECDDKEVIKKILGSVCYTDILTERRKAYFETRYLHTEWRENCGCSKSPKHPELWKEAFHEVFGDNAVIETGYDAKKMAQIAGYTVITPAHDLDRFLEGCGIDTDRKVAKDDDAFLLADIGDVDGADVKALETPFTLSYRAKKWGKLRIMLDAISNHLPKDSGGSAVRIEFRVKQSSYSDSYRWVAAKSTKPTDKIEGIRITDDGRGYSYENLQLLFSSKEGDEVGQFGEGMKMLSAACIREGLQVKFQSRDWAASSFSVNKTVDGKPADVLCYRVLTGVSPREGSMTALGNIDQEIEELFRRYDDYVLDLRDEHTPLHSNRSGEVFLESSSRSVKNGSIFNRGVFITDESADRLLFSYNISTENLSPDRDIINFEELRNSVKRILETCKNPEVISRVLKAAETKLGSQGKQYFEFIDLDLADSESMNVALAWKHEFYNIYGDNAVIFTKPFMAAEAIHKGFNAVQLDPNIANTLHKAGVEYDSEVVWKGLNAEYVDPSDLTDQERKVLEDLKKVDKILGLSPHKEIKVCSKIYSVGGRDFTAKMGGFWDGENLHILRSQLSDFASATRTYIHERGHKETGASDPEDEFRVFFEYYVSAFVGERMAELEGNDSYKTGIEAFSRWDIHRAEQMERKLTELESEVKRLREVEEEAARLRGELKTRGKKAFKKTKQREVISATYDDMDADPLCVTIPYSGRIRYGREKWKCNWNIVYVRVSSEDKLMAPIEVHNTLSKVLLVARSRVLGFLTGRPNADERKVDVFVAKRNDWHCGTPERIEKVNDREKIRILRRIAHQEKPGKRGGEASLALSELKNRGKSAVRFRSVGPS